MTLEQFDSSVSRYRVKILANEMTPDEIQRVINAMKNCGKVELTAETKELFNNTEPAADEPAEPEESTT